MKIANADKLIHHFENTVDVKLFTVPEIVTIIKNFSVETKSDTLIIAGDPEKQCEKAKQITDYYLDLLFGKKKPGIDNKLLSEKQISDVRDEVKMTTLVTLSDGWGHVREAYYDKGRQLVFTEWTSVKELESGYININERKELSDSEVHKDD